MLGSDALGRKVMSSNLIPDPLLHRNISFIKSFLRIVGFGALTFSLMTGAVLLIFAEVLGIVEELV